MDGPANGVAFAALAAELGDLKRLRDARGASSIAQRLFVRGWEALCGGGDLTETAWVTTADAVAAARLAGLDAPTLARAGIAAERACAILRDAIDAVAGEFSDGTLRAHVGRPLCLGIGPAFVAALAAQPRAGATCPGRPRIVLEPPESHADHCLLVAVLGTLLSPVYGADPSAVFLMGMSHHLHNAVLPDSGFTGEMLLGEDLGPAMRRLFDEGYAQMPAPLEELARKAMALAGDASSPEGRAFNAADVIDRVTQMRHYEQVAKFRASQAMDLNLVHEGPVQAFHFAVLEACGLS